MSVDKARQRAIELLRDCRNGVMPVRMKTLNPPTVDEATRSYAKAKGIKESSLRRYQSILRTHFGDWAHKPITCLGEPTFAEHCAEFARTQGNAIVSIGRGFITALIKYVNAVHGQNLASPFRSLADAGLLPPQPNPRARRLKESELPQWCTAVNRLPELQRDYLVLLAMTGLRRNEGSAIRRQDIDLEHSVLRIPDTKNGKPHSLPITAPIKDILTRRSLSATQDRIFHGLSADHVKEMAVRAGAPDFTLHDLRKLLATVGERLSIGDAILRRILNHTAPKSDVLYRHYVSLDLGDVDQPLTLIQIELQRMMRHLP